jgi:predicted anti-sigma-YlaC factor YlaD
MTELSGCDEIRLALGVYVLGAIDPAERVIVDAHLTHCQECREELAGLAGLPALLGRVPLHDAERLALDDTELRDLEEPSAELLDSLLGRISARRRARRSRGVVAAAAAAVIAVGGGIGGGVLISHGQGLPTGHHAIVPATDVVVGSNARTHVTAVVTYTQKKSATTMKVLVTGIRTGTYCEFWLTTSSGEHLLVGSWTVNGSHQANWYGASSSVAAAKVRSFDISAAGKVLVTIPAT